MIAAILERHGLRTGAYTSPHLISYRERVQIGERDIDAERFAAAVARAAWAAERVNRTLAEDDHVTQFELLTAAALWRAGRRRRRGGGRRGRPRRALRRDQRDRRAGDGAHERRPRAHALAGPDGARHRRGEARRRSATGATLVLGADLAPRGAGGRRARRGASAARGSCSAPPHAEPAAPLRARGAFQRRNFALAAPAAEAYLSALGSTLRERGRRARPRRDRGAGAPAARRRATR